MLRTRNKCELSSQYSTISMTARKTTTSQSKEMAISKKIDEVFRQREFTKQQTIRQTILNDNGKVYAQFREKYKDNLVELEKGRVKILKSKKTRFKIERRLKNNTRAQIKFICSGIKETWFEFEKQYFESDHFRIKLLMDTAKGISAGEEDKLEDQKDQ